MGTLWGLIARGLAFNVGSLKTQPHKSGGIGGDMAGGCKLLNILLHRAYVGELGQGHALVQAYDGHRFGIFGGGAHAEYIVALFQNIGAVLFGKACHAA